MNYKRSAGILLHPTSLPGRYGVGDIGPEARKWVDFLESTGCTLWQMLPLGPTGYGDSPYQCFSTFAGNPLLISPDDLLTEGLLDPDDIIETAPFPIDRVDYANVIPYKLGIIDRSFNRFRQLKNSKIHTEFEDFKRKESAWLDDFSLFMAIKETHGGASWVKWAPEYRHRDSKALNAFKKNRKMAIERHAYRQFLFFRQWQRLKSYTSEKNIRIIGDIPIFVAHDSADVWAHPELFFIDNEGNPTVVAGVPPDYFSPTGQLWGNPLYRWDMHKSEHYSWWLKRLAAAFRFVDILRLDHFRGFSAYWEIPAGETTAVNGKWMPGPGAIFFETVLAKLGDLPIIAEDLGVITPDVIALRDRFHLPGMKVLVFAFTDDASNLFLPHNYTPNHIVYTGTHDNDTVVGWFQRVSETEKTFAKRYLPSDGYHIAWDMIRAAWASVAVMAVTPVQDILGLDNSARMNYPSKPGGNWTWRMHPNALNDWIRQELNQMNKLYGRLQ